MRNWKTWGVPELASHDGMVWFRRAFRLTPEQAARPATLSLGAIDEVDQTWVNGRVIRNTFGWGTRRTYRLPAGALRAGDNVVVVNVLSTWDAGGMTGPPDALALTFDDGTAVPLAGEWRYRAVPLSAGRPPRAPWETIAGLTTLYNGMIAPMGPYGIRGAVWYQGETNADDPAGYEKLLGGLMASWRSQFGADLPFLVVQLPNFGAVPTAPVESNWADIRESQRRAVAADGRAGLAVTIDIGERDDIHPGNKQDVGRRLARAARHVIYGEAIAPSGPVPLSARREPAAVVVTFGDVERNLVSYSSSQAIGFELCGAGPGTCRFVERRGRRDASRPSGAADAGLDTRARQVLLGPEPALQSDGWQRTASRPVPDLNWTGSIACVRRRKSGARTGYETAFQGRVAQRFRGSALPNTVNSATPGVMPLGQPVIDEPRPRGDRRCYLAVVDQEVFAARGAVEHRLPCARGRLQFHAVAIRSWQHAAIGVEADVAPGDSHRANRRRPIEPAGQRRGGIAFSRLPPGAQVAVHGQAAGEVRRV